MSFGTRIANVRGMTHHSSWRQVISHSIVLSLYSASLAACSQPAVTTPPASAGVAPTTAEPPVAEPASPPTAPFVAAEDQRPRDQKEHAGPAPSASADAGSNDLRSLEERLLENLAARRTWKTNGVKIWLANPTVSVVLTTKDRKRVEVHAWPENQNDFNIAMMRIDRGDVLYAITAQEYQQLVARTARIAAPQ